MMMHTIKLGIGRISGATASSEPTIDSTSPTLLRTPLWPSLVVVQARIVASTNPTMQSIAGPTARSPHCQQERFFSRATAATIVNAIEFSSTMLPKIAIGGKTPFCHPHTSRATPRAIQLHPIPMAYLLLGWRNGNRSSTMPSSGTVNVSGGRDCISLRSGNDIGVCTDDRSQSGHDFACTCARLGPARTFDIAQASQEAQAGELGRKEARESPR